jgi:capsular polysaccharide biosynthesis protein
MSQQFLDLRRSAQIIRRRKMLVMIVAGLGLVIGIGYGVLNMPKVSSQALVVLPQGLTGVSTQVVIVSSDPVLSAALPSIRPEVSLQTLRDDVHVRSLTSGVISITAQGVTNAEAETAANAVANSYISYVGTPDSPVGHIQARMLEPAVTATGAGVVRRYLLSAVLGTVAGALIGMIISLAVGRHDRRLRERDEIANSIGIPVVASLAVEHPSDAVGWTKLLDEYEPGPMPAWRMRRGLQQLGLLGPEGTASSLWVLTLSSDPGALALGPQLAVFAARHGMATNLVIGPQQDPNTAAALYAACAAPAHESASRPRNFTATVSHDGDIDPLLKAALTVVVTVVDPQSAKVPGKTGATTTVIGVTAGKATAEQLARVAMAAAAGGREVAGILVADPDSTDRTTGRIPLLARPAHRSLPSRTAGIPTESRR